jgi:DNA invertase Pin-like site-specific DNA recombinase
MNKRIALYYRVSTADQNLDPQRLELQEHCARRGWEVSHEFCDKESGAKFSRSGLDQLMAAVRKGRIDIVVCTKLDRLGRSFPHLAQLIFELDNNRVALVCTSQAIDTCAENPAGRLTMHILVAMADFERSLIKERTLAGLKAARARGATLGRPRSIDQYRDRVIELKGRGMSRRAIAGELGIPASNVGRLLAKAA